MRICDIINRNSILIDLTGKDKTEIINKLVDSITNDTRVLDVELVRRDVLEREKIMSTGIGNGFAIPHAKTKGVNGMIAAFARLKDEVDFESMDGINVNLVFLLLGQENEVGPHIQILSRLSRLMKLENFKEELLDSKSPGDVFSLISNIEDKILR